MADFEFDAVVIGGGAVGLAVLHELAAAGWNAGLLERHDAMGRETSSRNSEVVHGGMYYQPGTIKAELSVAGRRRLYAFAEKNNVPHRRVGKIIVAVDDDETGELEKIYATGRENGVEELRMLSGREVARLAPGVRAVAGLHSPVTGVISAHALMNALLRAAENSGAAAVCGAEVTGLERLSGGWKITYRDREGDSATMARLVVNCAGLSAQRVMRMAGMDPETAGLRLYPCKGNYFAVGGESGKRIRGLIYPAPEKNLAGLGIHTLVDFGGGVKLGPNVEYVQEADEYDYGVNENLRSLFFERARRYLPFLDISDIRPDMSGIRPKLSGPGQPARDFYIAHEAERGLPGFINLAGIESPGLTSSLAIAETVTKMATGLL